MKNCCGWFNPCPPTCLGYEKMRNKKQMDYESDPNYNAALMKSIRELETRLQIATDLLAEDLRCHRAGVDVMMAEDPQYHLKYARELIDKQYEENLK